MPDGLRFCKKHDEKRNQAKHQLADFNGLYRSAADGRGASGICLSDAVPAADADGADECFPVCNHNRWLFPRVCCFICVDVQVDLTQLLSVGEIINERKTYNGNWDWLPADTGDSNWHSDFVGNADLEQHGRVVSVLEQAKMREKQIMGGLLCSGILICRP